MYFQFYNLKYIVKVRKYIVKVRFKVMLKNLDSDFSRRNICTKDGSFSLQSKIDPVADRIC